jgi:hypothetical protein
MCIQADDDRPRCTGGHRAPQGHAHEEDVSRGGWSSRLFHAAAGCELGERGFVLARVVRRGQGAAGCFYMVAVG